METFSKRSRRIGKIVAGLLILCMAVASTTNYAYAATVNTGEGTGLVRTTKDDNLFESNLLSPQEQQKLFDSSNQSIFEIASSGSAISGSTATRAAISEETLSNVELNQDVTYSGMNFSENIFSENEITEGMFLRSDAVSGTAITEKAVTESAITVTEDSEKVDKKKEKTESKAKKAKQAKNAKKKASKAKKAKRKKYLTIEEIRKKMNSDMDVSKTSGLSKKDFVKLVDNMKYDYVGVYKRNAESIWELCQKYQVNEIFILGIVAEESGWGSSEAAQATNNYTSQMSGGKLKHFESERACFERTILNLSKNYLDKKGPYYNGTTIRAVNEIYCEPGRHKDGSIYKYKWADAVYSCMSRII